MKTVRTPSTTRTRVLASVLYVLTLRPEGDGPPPIIRLRRVLKWLLRYFGLRCIDVREIDAESDAAGKAMRNQYEMLSTNLVATTVCEVSAKDKSSNAAKTKGIKA